MTRPAPTAPETWPPLELVRSLLAAIDGHTAAIGDEMQEAIADLRLGRLIRQAAAEDRMVIHASWHDRNGIVRGDYLTHPLDVALNNVAVQAQELLDLAADYEKEALR